MEGRDERRQSEREENEIGLSDGDWSTASGLAVPNVTGT